MGNNVNIILTAKCTKCTTEVTITQPLAAQMNILGVVPCTKCIKDMALLIIRSKKADFDATYDAIETALNELEGDNTEGMSEL